MGHLARPKDEWTPKRVIRPNVHMTMSFEAVTRNIAIDVWRATLEVSDQRGFSVNPEIAATSVWSHRSSRVKNDESDTHVPRSENRE